MKRSNLLLGCASIIIIYIFLLIINNNQVINALITVLIRKIDLPSLTGTVLGFLKDLFLSILGSLGYK